MRTVSISSIAYTPGDPPRDPEQLQRYLREEFTKISVAISLLAAGHIDKTYAAPVKPRDGDVRYADGTTWNPGSGAGVYLYKGSAWAFLG
jgi:hypothetical protein